MKIIKIDQPKISEVETEEDLNQIRLIQMIRVFLIAIKVDRITVSKQTHSFYALVGEDKNPVCFEIIEKEVIIFKGASFVKNFLDKFKTKEVSKNILSIEL